MVRARTYKELVYFFQRICDELDTVKFFSWGEPEEMNVNESGPSWNWTPETTFPDNQYPFVFLQPTALQVVQGFYQYTCNLWVLDISPATRIELLETHDTMLHIAQDILAKIKLTPWRTTNGEMYSSNKTDASISYPINFLPQTEISKNGLSGWLVTFTINVKNPLDLENAPFG